MNRTSPKEVRGPGPISRHELTVLLATLAGCAAYLLIFLNRGWIVGDEGMLGHSAERVLNGELPQADFRDPYTGGLSFFHALAFRLFGVQVLTTRFAVYFAALLFLVVVFRLARRGASALGAGAFTLLAMVWTLPNYFSSMPSWYVLFTATGALWALVRQIETGRYRWLVTAGVFVGASLAVKSTGLLFFSAVLLFLVYREQEANLDSSHVALTDRGVLAFRLFATGGLAAFIASLCLFFLHRPGLMEYVQFVAPGGVLAAFLIARAWLHPSGPAPQRLGRLMRDGGLFFAGFLVPVAAMLGPYAMRGVLNVWFDPSRFFQSSRLQFGVWSLPGPVTLICALPWAFLFLGGLVRRGLLADSEVSIAPGRIQRLGNALVALVAATVLALAAHPYVYQTVWFSLRPLIPILVLSGVGWLVLRADGGPGSQSSASSADRQILFATLAFTALASISQFPYSRVYYFCYIAPLVALSWLFLAGKLATSKHLRILHSVLGVSLGLFALLWLNLGWVETMDHRFGPIDHPKEVALDRAEGMKSEISRAILFEELVGTIQALTEPDEYILVLPDGPQVYFLADRRNPTGTILDYIDDDFGKPERVERLLGLLDTRDIRVVVIRRRAIFSPVPEAFVEEVQKRLPGRRFIGPFSVHWRHSTSSDEAAISPATTSQ